MSIDEKRFYLPKKIICGALWLCFVIYKDSHTSRTLLTLSDGSLGLLEVMMIGILVLYATYFAIIAYNSFFQSATLKDMKHSYKVSMMMTLAVIASFAALLVWTSNESDINSKENANIAISGLLNIYIYLIAFLYSPAMESLEDIQLKHARKEHEHIMNQFYEQELPDISSRTLETETKG